MHLGANRDDVGRNVIVKLLRTAMSGDVVAFETKLYASSPSHLMRAMSSSDGAEGDDWCGSCSAEVIVTDE